MEEIAAWLRAQAEADLTLARSAGGGEWHTLCRCEGECDGTSPCEEVEGDDIRIYAEGGHDCWQADHIAAHDPRDEIARAESVLAVLDEHARLDDSIWCRTCDPGGESGDSAAWYPCRTLRLLAYGYRHREGWQDGWKP